MINFREFFVNGIYWQDPPREALVEKAQDGCWIMIYVLAQTVILELFSLETARALYQKNAKLYKSAIVLNILNHLLLGVPGYAICNVFFTQEMPLDDDILTSSLKCLSQTVCIIAIHAGCFYQFHKIFHTYPKLYKWHKFHHLFNTHVPPMSANAVSPVEYAIAYLFPFLAAMVLIRPCETALWISILIISWCNVTMHTPCLEPLYDKYAPKWIVGTGDHLEHHHRLQCHYASPTFDLDYILEEWNGFLSMFWTTTAEKNTKNAMNERGVEQ